MSTTNVTGVEIVQIREGITSYVCCPRCGDTLWRGSCACGWPAERTLEQRIEAMEAELSFLRSRLAALEQWPRPDTTSSTPSSPAGWFLRLDSAR